VPVTIHIPHRDAFATEFASVDDGPCVPLAKAFLEIGRGRQSLSHDPVGVTDERVVIARIEDEDRPHRG
jgi:hypothetical protein